MSDDDKLEVLLVLSTLDDFVQGHSESRDVVSIKISCWFVESNDLKTMLAHETEKGKGATYTTVDTETFC